MGVEAAILGLWGGGTSVKPNVAHSLPLEGKVVSARIPDEVFRSVLVYKAGGASPSPTGVNGWLSYPVGACIARQQSYGFGFMMWDGRVDVGSAKSCRPLPR